MNIVRKRKSNMTTSDLELGNVISLVGYLRSADTNQKTDNPIFAKNYSQMFDEAWLVVGVKSNENTFHPEVKLMNLKTMELTTINRLSMIINPFTNLLRERANSSDYYDKNYNKTTLFLHEKIASVELEGAVREQSEVHGAWI